jgi:hypothetical protein
MTMRRAFMSAGACLALAWAAPWPETGAQTGRPASGPYVPSPVTIPSPVTVPGMQPPAASAPRPAPVDPPPSTGTSQAPFRQPPLPPSPGACRSYPGTIAGQPALPPC